MSSPSVDSPSQVGGLAPDPVVTRPPTTHTQSDAFKQTFKKYKRRNPPIPDLSQVLRPGRPHPQGPLLRPLKLPSPKETSPEVLARLGLTYPTAWEAWTLPSAPGIVLARGVLAKGSQAEMARSCLLEWALSPPNRNNIANLEGTERAR